MIITKINYVVGDATNPVEGDNEKEKIIAHITNDKFIWGAGFVLALSKKWKLPEQEYRKDHITSLLGNVQLVRVEKNIIVANMTAQHNVRHYNDISANKPPIRYDALIDCLSKLNYSATRLGAEIHMPFIGSGLAGGDWRIIEILIEQYLTVPVYIYELPK